MTNYKLHEDYKKLSWAVYQDDKTKKYHRNKEGNSEIIVASIITIK